MRHATNQQSSCLSYQKTKKGTKRGDRNSIGSYFCCHKMHLVHLKPDPSVSRTLRYLFQQTGGLLLDTFFSKRATARGSKAWSILTVSSVTTWIPRSAPIARAVLIVSLEALGPTETAMISLAFFCSC